MPCRDYIPDEYHHMGLRDENDKLTNYLCTMCKAFDSSNMPIPSNEVAEWWKKHKEEDRKKAEAEAYKKKLQTDKRNALKKLTKKEKKLLGL